MKKKELEITPDHETSLKLLNKDLGAVDSGSDSGVAEDFKFELREDNDTNTAMEVMLHNSKLPQESYVGLFWYDPDKQEVYGTVAVPASETSWYESSDLGGVVRTCRQLHQNVWKKEHFRGKDDRFNGDYTKKPRGRVFEFKEGGFKVYTGQWINYYPEAKEDIIYEFELPEDTQFIIDRHWDLGHGWSDDFLED